MAHFTRNLIITGLTLFGLNGCSVNSNMEDGIEIHNDAIRKVALAYGAQSGLAWESQRINNALEEYSLQLDRIYDFNSLMLYGQVLPPVIEESILSYNIANTKEVRLADKEIKIIKQARFVTTPPTWRDYVFISYDKPKVPSIAILPHNKDESHVWQDAVSTGWKQGVEQAHQNFETALRYLNRDFIGMSTYYTLLAQNMVSAPVTATTELGITGDENAMRIGDTVMRITAPAILQTRHASKWKPALEANVIHGKRKGKGSRGK